MTQNADAVPLPAEKPQSAEGAHKSSWPSELGEAINELLELRLALTASAARCARLEEERNMFQNEVMHYVRLAAQSQAEWRAENSKLEAQLAEALRHADTLAAELAKALKPRSLDLDIRTRDTAGFVDTESIQRGRFSGDD